MSGCVCGADEPRQSRCGKHGRDLHGYPCAECQREWRAANPEQAAKVDRLVRSILRQRKEQG